MEILSDKEIEMLIGSGPSLDFSEKEWGYRISNTVKTKKEAINVLKHVEDIYCKEPSAEESIRYIRDMACMVLSKSQQTRLYDLHMTLASSIEERLVSEYNPKSRLQVEHIATDLLSTEEWRHSFGNPCGSQEFKISPCGGKGYVDIQPDNFRNLMSIIEGTPKDNFYGISHRASNRVKYKKFVKIVLKATQKAYKSIMKCKIKTKGHVAFSPILLQGETNSPVLLASFEIITPQQSVLMGISMDYPTIKSLREHMPTKDFETEFKDFMQNQACPLCQEARRRLKIWV